MSQTFLFFEQQTRDAEQAAIHAKRAAKEAAAKARAEAKEKEEREKSTRRLMREAEYRRKHPPGHAQCGINWYLRAAAGPTATSAARPSFTPPTRTPSPRSAPAAGPDGAPASGGRAPPWTRWGLAPSPGPCAKGCTSGLLAAFSASAQAARAVIHPQAVALRSAPVTPSLAVRNQGHVSRRHAACTLRPTPPPTRPPVLAPLPSPRGAAPD